MLRWFKITGEYASALVAAETETEALAMAKRETDGWFGWFDAEPTDKPPGPPTAPGVYHWFAE